MAARQSETREGIIKRVGTEHTRKKSILTSDSLSCTPLHPNPNEVRSPSGEYLGRTNRREGPSQLRKEMERKDKPIHTLLNWAGRRPIRGQKFGPLNAHILNKRKNLTSSARRGNLTRVRKKGGTSRVRDCPSFRSGRERKAPGDQEHAQAPGTTFKKRKGVADCKPINGRGLGLKLSSNLKGVQEGKEIW